MSFGAIGSGSFGTAIAQQRTFSAPSTLRTTPMTGGHRESEAETFPRARAQVYAPPLVRSSSSPWPSSPSVEQPPPTPKVEERKDSPVQGFIARKLSLSNYVAPSVTSMMTPPTTPPGRARSASLPGDAGMHSDNQGSESTHDEDEKKDEQEAKDEGEQRTSQPAPKLAIIGGQPATSVSPVPTPAPPSSTASTAPKAPSSLPPLDFRIGSSELGAEMGVGVENPSTQLLSPPSSPVTSISPLALGLSGLSLGNSNGNNSGSSGSSTPTNMSRSTSFPGPAPTSPLDSSYAALIRQWCFTGSPSGSPTHSGTTTPAPGFGASSAGSMGGFGRGYGAGFPGFGVGGMADAGMVGGEHLVACFS